MPPVTCTSDGGACTAGAVGVAEAGELDAPVPTEFTADTRKSYDVPFVSPVTVAEVAVDVPSENTDHVESADALNSTT